MKDIIKEIQEEINQLMVSKIAKKSDAQLAHFEKLDKWRKSETNVTKNKRHIEIDQFDLSGNYIQTFHSVSEAAKTVNRARKSIIFCLIGKNKQSGGFIWKYKN